MHTRSIYKAIILDIDGTLINDHKVITAYTLDELKRVASSYGVYILLISSRVPDSVRIIRSQINASKFISSYNGALVIDDEKGDIVHSETLSSDIVSHLLSFPRLENIHVGIFSNDRWVVSSIDYWALREIRGMGVWPTASRTLDQIKSDASKGILKLHKIMFRGHKEDLDYIHHLIDENVQEVVNVFRSKDTIIEISAASSSKAKALKIISSKLGFALNEVIAFGDSHNDLDIIRGVGCGVAMDNAPSELKAAAKEITLSNNEDGVGLMLRKYFPD